MIRIFRCKIHLKTTKPITVIRKEILDKKDKIQFTEFNLNNDNIYIYSELKNNKRSHFFSSYRGVLKQTNQGTEIIGHVYFLNFFEIGFWILILMNLLLVFKLEHKAFLISSSLITATIAIFMIFILFERKRYTNLIQKLICNNTT